MSTVKLNKQSRWKLVALGCALSLLGSACGLFKRRDAADPSILNSRLAQLTAILAPPTNLTRSSGPATFLRLTALFPNAVGGGALAQNSFYPPEYSTGLSRSIADPQRPSSSLAQIALRNNAALLCDPASSYADPASVTQGAIFSQTGIYLSTETPPNDPVAKLALAAARNAWLDIYSPTSKEVQVLIELYNQAYAQSQSASTGRHAVCMAALLAPQFWIGNGGPRDALRRAAIEIGHFIPTFADFEALQNHKLTLDGYVKKIQTDPSLQKNYLSAVHNWAQVWWGLRDFQDYAGPFDPRGDGGGTGNGYTTPGISTAVTHWDVATFSGPPSQYAPAGTTSQPLLFPAGAYHQFTGGQGGEALESCQSKKSDGSWNIQPFDPRTTILSKEHHNPYTGNWEVVGAFVLPGYEAQYSQYIQAYTHQAYNTATECQTVGQQTDLGYTRFDPPTVSNYPVYKACTGRVSTDSSGTTFVTTHLLDFESSGVKDITPYGASPATLQYLATRKPYIIGDSYPKILNPSLANPLYNTIYQTFHPYDRRLRRKAPVAGDTFLLGWQDGIDKVNLYFSGDEAYTCNSLSRFMFTCAFRPLDNDWVTKRAARQTYTVNGYDSGLDATSTTSWWDLSGQLLTGDSGRLTAGAFLNLSSIAHPMTLNQFRCAPPQLGLAPAHSTEFLDDLSVFPTGFSAAPYDTVSSRPPVNTLATLVSSTAQGYYPTGATVVDGQVLSRLNYDMKNEPYYLLDEIISSEQPFTKMFTANYTWGGEELELFYRTQDLVLPAYPPGYVLSPPNSAARVDSQGKSVLRKIYRKSLPSIPLSWTRGVADGWTSANAYYSSGWPSTTAAAAGTTLPLATSGILTMPAFLGPVANSIKLRTVASRFFTRLMCGQPNIVQLRPGEDALHIPSVPTPQNSSDGGNHLDKTKGCYDCHINMDPLAVAFSANFLGNVGSTLREGIELIGEFNPHWTTRGAFPYMGQREAGEPGKGALMGVAVSGFEQIGQTLIDPTVNANHGDVFYSCIVTNAFTAVFGRPPVFYDAKAIGAETQKFKANPNFNQLIRDLVALPAYQMPD